MMNLKRRTGIAFGALTILTGAVVMAQSNKSQAPDPAKEWPTYGHDPGGMRFSPLTEITPANVERLKVAWVYHMTPPRAVGASGASTVVAPNAGAQVGVTPEGAPPGRGRGRGNAKGFAASEVT